MARSGRIVILANRLPVRRVGSGESARWESSPGGLVTAMQPVLQRRRGAWIGWSGAQGRAPRPFVHDGMRILPVRLSALEVERYYRGMANQTFWPLYHDAIITPEFREQWWEPYVEVNRRFATAAARVAGRGETVWVHDYHLQLVPRMLRELRPDLRIGFFLHIPFPPEELFEWLPWRREILEGLLGADVVGFQTHSAVRNFSRLAREYTEAEGSDTELAYGSRRVTVGSFPISIDFDQWEEAASSPEATRQADQIRRRLGSGRRVLLAVDRLDYTKGIDRRLLAFEQMLKRGRANVRRCVLVQIAVPGRDDEPEYARMRGAIERTVGRINGEFAEPGMVAVHYFRRNLAREELAAYYRAADVMLVTPLRDGMNLVAKEYAACRADGHGVLVLSEFAGAARQLRRAILVNPRSEEQMIEAMHEAMTMPASDAKMRMAILRMMVRRHDVHEWADSFLEVLRG